MFYIGEINTEKINRIRVRKLHPEWKNKNNYRITTLNLLNNKSNIH